MRHDTQQTQSNREPVDNEEQKLDADDTIDEAVQQLLCEDGMFFHELGKVVESRSYIAPLAFEPMTPRPVGSP